MKLLELGFLNPNRSASANFSSDSIARRGSYSPSFSNTKNAAEKDSFVKKNDNENEKKRLSRKLALYAATGIAVTAVWIYILIQNKRIEELTAETQRIKEFLASKL